MNVNIHLATWKVKYFTEHMFRLSDASHRLNKNIPDELIVEESGPFQRPQFIEGLYLPDQWMSYVTIAGFFATIGSQNLKRLPNAKATVM